MKKLIIVFISMLVIAVTITALLILKKQNESSNTMLPSYEEPKILYQELHLPIDDETKGATANQTCFTNALKFSMADYEDEKVVCRYYQVDGLKDEAVEQIINSKIKDKSIQFAYECYDALVEFDKRRKNPKPDEFMYTMIQKYIDGKSVSYYDSEYSDNTNWKIRVIEGICANFNNVLSIKMTSTNDLSFSTEGVEFININLVNGNDIKVEELFTKNISVKELFAKNTYKRFGSGEPLYEFYDTYEADGTTYTYGYGMGFYDQVDTVSHSKLVKRFSYSDDYNFGFTDEHLCIVFDSYYVFVNLRDYIENVAIYNRFLTDESIFDGQYQSFEDLPAFCGIAQGNSIVYSQSFVRVGNVVVNYYINYYGTYDYEVQDQNEIEFATNTIVKMIEEDVAKLNETYVGNNLILYTGKSNICVKKVDLNVVDEQYRKFFTADDGYITFTFNPDVEEISKDDFDFLQSNLYKTIVYNEYSFYLNTTEYVYNRETDNYEEHKLVELNRYYPYYADIRPEQYKEQFYSWAKPGERNFTYLDSFYYLLDGNYTRYYDSRSMIDKFIDNDRLPALASEVFDTIKNINDYSQIDKNNYSYNLYGISIEFKFPYIYTYENNSFWDNKYMSVKFLRSSDDYQSEKRTRLGSGMYAGIT